MRAVAGALAAVFALLALGMVVIHQQGHYEALLGVQARRADFHAQMRQLYKLLQHPDALAEAVMGGAQQKQLRASKLRAVAAPTHKLEESGEDAEENYLHSSFPTTNRKGLGPGLSVGDPVLNKWMKYKMAPPACILSGNCVEEGYDGHDDWRNLKQVQDTVDEDMEDQLDYLFRSTMSGLEACQEGFGEDEEMVEKCEMKETRKMCYMFESMSQLCDSTLQERKNELDSTYYYHKAYVLKSCTNDVRTALVSLCAQAEKIPVCESFFWCARYVVPHCTTTLLYALASPLSSQAAPNGDANIYIYILC
jgi:hypothetical protein